MRLFTIGIEVLASTLFFVGAAGAQASALPKRTGNRFELRFPRGGGVVEWVSASTFRFARNWNGDEPERNQVTKEAIEVSAGDAGDAFRFQTRYLTVDIRKDGAAVTVRSGTERVLSRSEIRRADSDVVIEYAAAASERFYGLGSRREAKLDLRGSTFETREAFFVSSEGYAEYYPAAGMYKFDLGATRAERRVVTVPGDRLEYFFYYGPTPKEILEEHQWVNSAVIEPNARDFEVRPPKSAGAGGSWDTLRQRAHELAHGAFSGKLIPEFDLAPYASSELTLFARAAQFGSMVPALYASRVGLAGGYLRAYEALERRRARWVPFFVSYAAEARDRGIPMLRPIAMQFPEDAAAANRAELFMLGDEVLLAPVLASHEAVPVYLPKGIWTDLRTNEIFKGRQEIAMRATPDEMPAFARNGTIVPLAAEHSGAPMELHYFPKLGAEFFLYENNGADFSQFHAAPATDFLRLEIESKVDRDYEWVVHHLGPCREVAGPGVESWRHDKVANNLHIRVRGKAGADQVVNISF